MTTPASAITSRRRRTDWIGGVFAAILVAVLLAGWLLDIQSFAWFLLTMTIDLVITILFLVWWFTRRSFTWPQRLLVFACAVLFGLLIAKLTVHTIGQPGFLIFSGIPLVLVLWWVFFIATLKLASRARTVGLIACMALAWGAFLLVRVHGYRGNLQADVHWRWTPTEEELYLAQHGPGSSAAVAETRPAQPLQLRPGDWPGFRGPGRDAVVHGIRISLDWSQSPPQLLWRERIGPAWSSMAVVDGYLFTQEQRGDREAVVCRDVLTGREAWVHEDPGRFEEAMSGVGPRATPTFADGRIYAQGALGTLNCLDAATGKLIWSRDLRKDADATLPIWAFCSSPLVLDNRVIVFAGGDSKKGLLAYSCADGHPLWTADAGKVSYASPQAYEDAGGRDVVIFTNEGLFAVEPATGTIRWHFPVESAVGIPASIQACAVSAGSLVIGNGAAFGTECVRIPTDGSSPSRQWATPRMKPSFSDMVYLDGFLYGFDGTVFCCVDAASGARRWRDGRYGAGQVLLLADQGVMIITSEDGQAILVRCNSDHHEELGRIHAVEGKTWNHPAIAGNRLYVRSDGEIACFQLK